MAAFKAKGVWVLVLLVFVGVSMFLWGVPPGLVHAVGCN